MTRSSRLLAAGLTVLALAVVVLLLAQRNSPEPIVVTEPAVDTAAEVEDTAPSGTVGALDEDASRLPSPLAIPDGHEAVAVTATYDAAVAGLPAPGDAVNVYGVFTNGLPEQLAEPDGASDGPDAIDLTSDEGVARVLSGVEVLGVTGVEAASGGGTVTLVLALEPDDAERTIYLAGVERIWFSLVAADHEPVDGAGVTRDSVLDDAGL